MTQNTYGGRHWDAFLPSENDIFVGEKLTARKATAMRYPFTSNLSIPPA